MITNIVYKYINEFLKDDDLVDKMQKIKEITNEQKNIEKMKEIVKSNIEK